MDDCNFQNISQNKSVNSSNNTNCGDGDDKIVFILHVVTCIIIAFGLPLILMAIYALYALVRNGNAAPIYIINLLMSDLIQLCCMIISEFLQRSRIFNYTYNYAVLASVYFMVCVALERYLVIACPLWYRFGRNIKIPVLVCALVWTLTLVPVLIHYFGVSYEVLATVVIVLHLLPLPLLLFFLVGTLRALSASKAVHSDEKRRIVGMLVLVLLIYMILFLPSLYFFYLHAFRKSYVKTLSLLSAILLRCSPLADMVLYIFMKKGTIDKLLSTLCWCRMDSNDNRRPSESMMTTFTQSAP